MIYRYILIFLYFLLSFGNLVVYAQVPKIDSLKTILLNEKDELKKIDLLNELFNEQYTTDIKKGLHYALSALELSESIENKTKSVQNRISESANNVGACYLILDNYEKSLEYLLKALKVAESVQDTSRMSNALYNLSNMFDYKGDIDKSNEYLAQAITLDEMKGDYKSAANGYSILAANYFFNADYDKGMDYYQKAMKIYQPLNDIESISILYGNRAVGLKKIKKYDEALKYYQLALDIDIKLNNKMALEVAYLNIADVYIKMKKNEKAVEYNLKSLEIAKELNSVYTIMNAYSGLSESFEQIGNKDKALEYLQLYANWKDTLYNKENSEAMAEMSTKYETEKKEAQNSLLLAEKQIDKIALDKKSSQQKMLAIGLGLALLVVGYIGYSLNQKKKTNKLLNTQNEEISLKNNIIEEKNKDITDSINYAQRIQNAILPEIDLLQSVYDSFVYYRPKDIVSGDFYWIKEVEDRIFFSVVDCTGHGVPGAFMSIIGYNSLNRIIDDYNIRDTGLILDKLNELVTASVGNKSAEEVTLRDGMDLSICCINKKEFTLTYSGANNSLYLLRSLQKTALNFEPILTNDHVNFYEIKPDKMAIGGGVNKAQYKTHQLKLEKGDSVYLFSDGYADQFGGPDGKKFMYKRFKQMILDINNEDMTTQLSIVDKTMKDWKGCREQLDDICLMGLKV